MSSELHFGDNLEVLRKMPAAHVDVIYLDPPFNSNADYNILYGTKKGGPSKAQSHVFEDTWKWGLDAKRAMDEVGERHLEAGALLEAFDRVFPESDMLAYLSMMAVRLIEMHRVLKSTGGLYLHCDPTASHYLKLLLDTIFSPRNFQNEIIWRRTRSHNDISLSKYGSVHDTILFYAKDVKQKYFEVRHQERDPNAPKSHDLYTHTDGIVYRKDNCRAPGNRGPLYEWNGHTFHWRYSPQERDRLIAEGRIVYSKTGMPRVLRPIDPQKGAPLQDVWNDIDAINSGSNEILGYPTQKPIKLLERILSSSSKEGDAILDPFCGCGTAIEAAQKMKRNWIGIDVTYLAIHVIEGRMVKEFGETIKETYKLYGRPEDEHDARILAAKDWLEFQKWAVFMLGGIAKDRAGADGGIDGIIRYHEIGSERPKRAIVSVKGGLNVGVDAVHKLKSVMEREKSEIGVLVCLDPPGQPMRKEAASKGEIGPKKKAVAAIQIVTVDMLFKAGAVQMPGMIDYPEIVRSANTSPTTKRRRRHKIEGQGELLLPITGGEKQAPAKRRGRSIREVEVEVTRAARPRRA